MDNMINNWGRKSEAQSGFSLIELLVVLLIFAILIAITVPSFMSTRPERNLASAVDVFATDFGYARAKAQQTGSRVFIAFDMQPDARQCEGWWDAVADAPSNAAPSGTSSGSYINPNNPGINRSSRKYYIVEERPRWIEIDANGNRPYDPAFNPSLVTGQAPFTYLDWLNQFDAWSAGTAEYPVEPLYPYDAAETFSPLGPEDGAFNDASTPLIFYPQNLGTGGSDTQDYVDRWIDGPTAPTWDAGDRDDQAMKIFCTADELEILNFDRTVDFDVNGDRIYTHGSDSQRMKDQILDYIILKTVELPDEVFFMNPWKNTYPAGWEDVDNNGVIDEYKYADMQFLQFLITFSPDGEVYKSEWTFDPEPYPDGNYYGQCHGRIQDRLESSSVHAVFMVIAETLDFGSPNPIAKAMVQDNKKANSQSAGRAFTYWTNSGKYFVDDYTPNDKAHSIDRDDPRLDLGNVSPQVAREFVYRQDFLSKT
ncbi:MAG: prepilin-type N-terminal cleavage/methylation domain-containing protein [bacterium]